MRDFRGHAHALARRRVRVNGFANVGYLGCTISPLRSQALTVFLASPVLLSISLIGRPALKRKRRIIAGVPTLVAP